MKNKTNEELIQILVRVFQEEKNTKELLKEIDEVKEKIINELWERIPKIGGRAK